MSQAYMTTPTFTGHVCSQKHSCTTPSVYSAPSIWIASSISTNTGLRHVSTSVQAGAPSLARTTSSNMFCMHISLTHLTQSRRSFRFLGICRTQSTHPIPSPALFGAAFAKPCSNRPTCEWIMSRSISVLGKIWRNGYRGRLNLSFSLRAFPNFLFLEPFIFFVWRNVLLGVESHAMIYYDFMSKYVFSS